MPRQSQMLVLPRGLILLASVWLVASWILAIGLRAPVEPSSASYTPGVRLMLMCVAIGLMIGWPVLRLSQSRIPLSIRQTLLDLVVLLALVQVVVWPLRLVTPWPPARTFALDATLAGWAALAGAMVASAVGSTRAGPRNLAMLACVSMCLAGPAAAWVGVLVSPVGDPAQKLLTIGPLMEIHALTEGGSAPVTPQRWRWLVVLTLANLAAWTALSIAKLLDGSRTSPSMDPSH
ncbi:MAG: hypothetical protein ACE10B_00250 [Phycisphaerales bacterium]|nr:hypothetical protein [Planctomycetota bacterium]MCZ6493180.1 hypothetical protein [Planctomycetota bacterium]MCZ6611475.1 hypothetical protein [Planctomycetota bacterium]MCZ6736141.1 hypothetical protein [Planctomycetota bacterium]MCZ6811417.1 hypothetical protein [Planctomycetota bacterium]